MATRNFVQQGQAYGSTTATIIVTLDGVEIYSGPVPTVDQPLPPMPGVDIEDTACTWTLPADFSGSKSLTVQVQGSIFVLADTLADRADFGNTAQFLGLPYQQTIDGQPVNDPLTNVTIDDVSYTRGSILPGQWYWTIYPGQTLTATLNISAGINYPDWDPAQSYPSYSNVVYQTVCYSNATTATAAGLVPSENPGIWFPLPFQIWNINSTYPIWSQVVNGNKMYMAVQNVPAGIDILNTNYWEYKSG